jgi:hypothetical protein
MQWLIEKLSHLWECPDPCDLVLLPIVLALVIEMMFPYIGFIPAMAIVIIMAAVGLWSANHLTHHH